MSKPYLSAVIPFYNEGENIPTLLAELEDALKPYDYEIIFIDDGSSDNSIDILKESREKNRRIKIIQFNTNYGQHASFVAGFLSAKGEIIVMLDADLQNDPKDIPRFVNEIENNGMSAVFGWRTNRENSLLYRQIPSIIFNYIRNNFIEKKLHDYGCALNAFRREFIDELADKPDHLKHITTYIASKKVPITEVKIEERVRSAGKSRYDFIRLLQLGLDLLITTASKPVATAFLLVSSAISFIFALIALLGSLPSFISGNAGFIDLIFYPWVFFMGGLMASVLALINERIAGLLRQQFKKPLYIIKEYLD